MKKPLIMVFVMLAFGCCHAQDFFHIKYASMVKRYKNGYLLTVGSIQDSRDFQNYRSRITRPLGDAQYIPIDTVDYEWVKLIYNVTLHDDITLFGTRPGEYAKVKGAEYLLEDSGDGPGFENVIVFIPADTTVDKIQPIWGKNFEQVDSSFRLVDKSRCLMTESNNSVYSKIFKQVVSDLSMQSKKKKLHVSDKTIAQSIHINIYNLTLLPYYGPNYFIVADGITKDKNTSFSYYALLDTTLQQVGTTSSVAVTSNSDKYYMGLCPLIVYNIYHSDLLHRDIAICGYESTDRAKLLFYEYQDDLKTQILYRVWFDL